MRIVFFGNNWLGWKIFKWLLKIGDVPECLVLHPPEEQTYGDQLKALSEEHGVVTKQPGEPGTGSLSTLLEEIEPDLGISVLYGKYIPTSLLDMFSEGVVNLHPSYLPYNRGTYPNVWSLLDETPAGVSLHFLDEGIDTGDIIVRRRVDKEPVDTGRTLYRKLEVEGLALFKETWPDLKQGNYTRTLQEVSSGTYHESTDLDAFDEIDLDEQYEARELINLLRARTFRPHESAYFLEDGRKIHVRVELEYADENDH